MLKASSLVCVDTGSFRRGDFGGKGKRHFAGGGPFTAACDDAPAFSFSMPRCPVGCNGLRLARSQLSGAASPFAKRSRRGIGDREQCIEPGDRENFADEGGRVRQTDLPAALPQ